ncbi:MAG: Mg chelatase, subunit ChlI [Candidatus Gallionella acididurans]|uniref:Mg chelatase, subunit ChlI n=1 Tax=Candidatus Gallionella acididurans TaxID=1796491 RepID=A0A139BPD8_9PROT|nr:MAG: Mg chelatase, subunit ChlI [Candidatus Gallionella acididurans]
MTEIDTLCAPDEQGIVLLQQAISHFSLSARAYHRLLKVACTIADPEADHDIATKHIAEAVQYRHLISEVPCWDEMWILEVPSSYPNSLLKNPFFFAVNPCSSRLAFTDAT